MLRLAFASGDRPPIGTGREVNTWRDRDGEVFARLFVDGPRRRIEWPGLGVFVFEPGSEAVTLWADPDISPEVSLDVFGRAVLPAAIQALGGQALHASGVIVDGSALLLCGRSGSGKSTTAFALARAGCPQIADDSIVVDTSGDSLTAVPLPFRPRLRAPSREHFRDASPGGASTQTPLRIAAIVELVQLGGVGRPSTARLRPAEAFSVALSHAHCFDPADPAESRRLSQDYLRLAGEVPMWRLSYPAGLEHLPALGEMLLDMARAAAVPATPGVVR